MLSEQDRQAIIQIHERWIEEELNGRAAAVLELCIENVTWIPPDGPALHGKKAIEEWLSGPPAELKNLEISELHIAGDGSVAYKTADYSTVYVAAGQTLATAQQGTHLWVLDKSPENGWRVKIVAWNVAALSEAYG